MTNQFNNHVKYQAQGKQMKTLELWDPPKQPLKTGHDILLHDVILSDNKKNCCLLLKMRIEIDHMRHAIKDDCIPQAIL